MSVRREQFGDINGAPVERFTLANRTLAVSAISYGGIITSIAAPDRGGAIDDIVLGFDSLAGYLGDHPYFGAIVGRYANRIANGRFAIDGVEYRLATNNGPHHLHGGVAGFDKQIWRAEPMADRNGVVFAWTSHDGDEGYPGRLDVTVSYELTDRDELIAVYEATTDKPTHVNLTQHSYFNLAGAGRGDVLGHELTIDADRYTPVDATLIPTGALDPVDGTRFDFRQPRAIGDGFDHNWALNGYSGSLRRVARVREPQSGRTLDVSTTEPGMQVYTADYLDGTLVGKSGRPYRAHAGFCVETQHYPDTPNQPAFPSTLLRPGERYRSTTVFAFGVSR
jgi:aldose 1-epimerase